MSTDNLLRKLLHSDEPLVRFKAITTLYSGSNNIILQQELRNLATRSPLVTALLFECDKSGVPPFKPYTKWYGSHWILAVLADMCCPPGDQRLRPLQDQSLRWLFPDDPPRALIVNGRVRRCASIDGNALYYSLKLGLGAELNTRLEERLLDWQWPDGGWNCDRRPEASNSSFMESLIPMRALALYSRESGDETAAAATERAAEIFLKRRLFRSECSGNVISGNFLQLHYPCYWHYDILFALKVLAEAGYTDDRRTSEALDILEARQLPGGGWPADRKYYRVSDAKVSGRSLVNWGGTGKKKMNEFVTVDALYVLASFGRLSLPSLESLLRPPAQQ